ncbi:glycosyltransferase [Spongisporangium articulatum]|uniref:Glycosyltransferase n=1 Tax=Spongisporangium articulatum TaxID=3362603 RepID=A0ABW8AH28_9ACTN
MSGTSTRARARSLARAVLRPVLPFLPARARAAVRRQAARTAPPRRLAFDDHRWAVELADDPLFTDPEGGRAARLEAESASPGEYLRHIKLARITLELRAPEVESIREHGIVRLQVEKLYRSEMPPPGVAFVTVTNDKYAPGVEALVLSLQRQYPGMTNDVVVFHDESLSELSRGRLRRIHPQVRFEARSTRRYDVGQIGDSLNHRRVGLLGYLSIECLALDEYERVILLDADTVVLGDLSRLWRGDAICAVPDHGLLPFGMVAGVTGRPVINSGMLSFPRHELGAAALSAALELLPRMHEPVDLMLDNFADQKFWNLYLAHREVDFVPVNYNANRALVDKHFPDVLPDVALLHMTGPKPWYVFSDQNLVRSDERERLAKVQPAGRASFALWNQLYLGGITRSRINSFHAECGPDLADLAGTAAGRPAVLIGNGPSLQVTDLTPFEGFEKFAFNWFVHHDRFDEIRPDHLVLASHMFYGGWHTTRPAFPAEFLTVLTAHEHRPRLWTSYYFKDLVEATPELSGYDVSYFLFEKPFKVPVGRRGEVGLDLLAPLTDANTGVLTAGVPIALHLGSRDLVLVGCDSDYSSASGSYFYAAESHTSRTTDEGQLVRTWAAGGPGQHGYARYAEELSTRGVTLRDATVGGKLTVLPRIELADVASLVPENA